MDTQLHSFEALFERDLVREIYDTAKPMSVKAGETILEYGHTIRQIPIITKGSVKVLRRDDEGRELLLYYVNANESCAMTFTCCMEHSLSEGLEI